MAKTTKNGKVSITGKVDAYAWIKANGGYPEVGTFTDEKSIQKFYKQLTTEEIEDWSLQGSVTAG